MSLWRRSTTIQYPRVWCEFTIFNSVTKQLQPCVIMDNTENYHETVIKHLTRIHIENTPIEQRPEILADQVSITEKEALWRLALKQRLSLMCVLKHTPGQLVIVAAMINARRSPRDVQPELQGKRMRWLWFLQEYTYAKSPFYVDFNVRDVITYMAAYVVGGYNDTFVLMHMFKCRELLSQITRIRLSLACFPMGDIPNQMQEAAAKAGFKEYIRVPYEELASLDKTYQLPKCGYFTLMFNYYL